MRRRTPRRRQRRQVPPVVRPHAGVSRRSIAVCTTPWPAASSSAREEPGAAVAHRQQRLAVDGRLEAEAEQVRLALPEEPVDVDVVADRLAGAGQAAMERDDGVEQPVDGQPARGEVDAEIAGQEQVGLPGFDGDAGRDAPPSRYHAPGRMSCSVTTRPEPATAARPRSTGCDRRASAARRAAGRESDSDRSRQTRRPSTRAMDAGGEFQARGASRKRGRGGVQRPAVTGRELATSYSRFVVTEVAASPRLRRATVPKTPIGPKS